MLSRFKSALQRRHNIRAHFWQSMANYVQMGGGLLLGIVLARMLQPDVFGEIVSISAFLAFAMIPLSFSASQVLVSDGGRTRELFERVVGMVWVISVAKLFVLAAYVTWALMNDSSERAVIAALVGLPLALADWLAVIRNDLEGRGLFKPNFYVQLSGLAIHAAVAISLVHAGYGIYGLALGGFVAFFPQFACYLLYTDRELGPRHVDKQIFHEQFSLGFWLWLNYIAAGWFCRIDKIFLGSYGGATQLGYYNRAFNYGPISHLALNSLVTNATVRGLATRPAGSERQRLFYRTMAVVVAGGICNGFFWWQCAPALVPLLFGQQWAPAIPAFRVFGWLSFVYVFTDGAATILLAEERYHIIALIRVFGLVLLLTCLVYSAWRGPLDAVGLSSLYLLATFITGLVMSFAALYYLHQHRVAS
jgi:O-antigen/teichoic acid export membrane protein